MLRTLLGGSGDTTAAEPGPEPEPEPEPPTDEQLRDAFAEAIEDTDEAAVLGALFADLVDLAHDENRKFTERLRALSGLKEDIDPDDPRALDTVEAEAYAIEAIQKSLQARSELLAAERETHDHDESLEPLDPPNKWTREASTHGEAYIEAAIRARETIRDRGEATDDEVYRIYRRMVPSAAISRWKYGTKWVPVLAGADGVEARLYRLDPDEALDPDEVDEAAREQHYRFTYGPEVVAAAYRELLDGPDHGFTRLGLAHAARQRSNIAVTPDFVGPVDPDDIVDGQTVEDWPFLSTLLDLPGVQAPADPEWRWVGGEDDDE